MKKLNDAVKFNHWNTWADYKLCVRAQPQGFS